MVKVLSTKFKNRIKFNQTSTVDQSLVRKRYFYISDESDSDGNTFFANNSVWSLISFVSAHTSRQVCSLSSLLDDLIPESCVTNLETSDFSILVDDSNVRLFNIELNLNTTSI
jgi:hypothetical protein